MDFSFGKDKRLLNAQDFKAVFDKSNKKIHSKHLLTFVKYNQHSHPRLGLAITKKKLKNANDRNRLKRLIREHFRHHQHQIQNLDLVFIVKISFTKQDYSAIKAEINEIFSKLTTLLAKQHQ